MENNIRGIFESTLLFHTSKKTMQAPFPSRVSSLTSFLCIYLKVSTPFDMKSCDGGLCVSRFCFQNSGWGILYIAVFWSLKRIKNSFFIILLLHISVFSFLYGFFSLLCHLRFSRGKFDLYLYFHFLRSHRERGSNDFM